jgi:dephospho-CoA kinase
VEPSRSILRVGLTGGIASGKTTVARVLAELGAYVLDADAIAHEAIEPGGAAYAAVASRFPGAVDERGRIVRARLGSIVFHDAASRAALNAIVHPLVRAELERRIAEYASAHHAAIAVVDAALLVESGMWKEFHRVVVVSCSRESQITRLVARDGLSLAEAQARIDAQAPLEQKLAVADYVIDTDGTMRSTREATERVYGALLVDFEREVGPGST